MKGLRSWPANARWLLLLAVAALALTVVGHVTTFRIVGRHHFGVFTFWAEARQCVSVAQITPATWPMIADDKLRQLDCVLQVGDLDTTIEANYQRRNAYLAELRARGVQEVALQVQRGDRLFSVQAPIGVYTAKNVLEITIVLALSGLSLGVLGLLVLAAAPDVEANRVWAAFLFLGLLVLGGAINGYDDHLFRYTYDFLAIMGPRPWLGALLFQLAFVFPKPFLQGRWRLIRYLWYLPALVVFLGFLRLYGGFILGDPWLSNLEVWVNHGVTLIFGSGVLVLLLRSLYIILRHASQRYTWQAVFIIAGWLLALPISFLEMILSLLGLNWLLGGITNLTLMFWVVPGATLIAYAMLRYQSFAYRGAALNVLVILLMSATLTQVYSLFISRRGWDGVQFATVWGGVLLATLFWYIDSPLRRGFRRLFVRHEFDYQIADRFSRRLNEVSGVEATLRTAAAELQSGLEVAWAAVQAASPAGAAVAGRDGSGAAGGAQGRGAGCDGPAPFGPGASAAFAAESDPAGPDVDRPAHLCRAVRRAGYRCGRAAGARTGAGVGCSRSNRGPGAGARPDPGSGGDGSQAHRSGSARRRAAIHGRHSPGSGSSRGAGDQRPRQRLRPSWNGRSNGPSTSARTPAPSSTTSARRAWRTAACSARPGSMCSRPATATAWPWSGRRSPRAGRI